MKNEFKLICLLVALMMLLPSCARNNVDVFTGTETDAPEYYPDIEAESQAEQTSQAEALVTQAEEGKDKENPFVNVKDNATSRVVATASTASYRHFCNLVNSGYTLSELKKCSYSFKGEEFLNYLSSSATDMFGDSVFTNNVSIGKCLWNEGNYFLKITLSAKPGEYIQNNNIVFYIDVSESMWDASMLPMLINNAEEFTGAVDENDVVSVVTSAPENSVLLDSVSGEHKESIISAFENMTSKSAANNHDALRDAYELAEKNYISEGANKVVLISDGDISERYCELVSEYVQKGIELTVIGLGAGNYKNEKLQKLANAGCGEYVYIDGEIRARELLAGEIFKNSEVVAKNLIANISFDEGIVSKYRLIGYDSKESGEGVGQEQAQIINNGDIITLCYELELVDDVIIESQKLADAQISYTPYGTEDKTVSKFEISFDKYVENDGEMNVIMSAVQTLMVLSDSQYGKNIKLSDVYNKLSDIDFEQYQKASELYELLGIITGKVKK